MEKWFKSTPINIVMGTVSQFTRSKKQKLAKKFFTRINTNTSSRSWTSLMKPIVNVSNNVFDDFIKTMKRKYRLRSSMKKTKSILDSLQLRRWWFKFSMRSLTIWKLSWNLMIPTLPQGHQKFLQRSGTFLPAQWSIFKEMITTFSGHTQQPYFTNPRISLKSFSKFQPPTLYRGLIWESSTINTCTIVITTA